MRNPVAAGYASDDSSLTHMDNSEPCLACGKPVYGYEPMGCCDGRECACMGQPINPCVCDQKCWLDLLDGKRYSPQPSQPGESL